MNQVRPVLFQLLQRLAVILQYPAIDSLDLAFRVQNPNEAGDAINDQARIAFAFTQRLFRALSFGQIEHERDTLVATFFEQRAANQHRHAAAILAKEFLLERLKSPS